MKQSATIASVEAAMTSMTFRGWNRKIERTNDERMNGTILKPSRDLLLGCRHGSVRVLALQQQLHLKVQNKNSRST